MVSGASAEEIGNSKIAQLIDHFMAQVSEVTDAEDWVEADGWRGKWTIVGDDKETVKVYEIREGKFWPTGPEGNFVGKVTMSEDTFIDLIDAALHGKGEHIFAEKYAKRAIEYEGDQWIVDSERFRKVLKRLSSVKIGKLPS